MFVFSNDQKEEKCSFFLSRMVSRLVSCLSESELDLSFAWDFLSLYFAGLRHYCLFSGTWMGQRPTIVIYSTPTDSSANGSVHRPETGLRWKTKQGKNTNQWTKIKNFGLRGTKKKITAQQFHSNNSRIVQYIYEVRAGEWNVALKKDTISKNYVRTCFMCIYDTRNDT